ncbi:hypothetical protein NITLEN_11132 [Nitrospira lenta]|uniref:Uncharacterized protein n=1 Tax=Nitrospira lenta TaxID=1436998 RepID=A0A330LAQ7_9BACT|nr:hypothetical protein NITLEN_11132 [Nitrospira lenta]
MTHSLDDCYSPRSFGMIGAHIHEGTYSPEKSSRVAYHFFAHEDRRPHRIRQSQETGCSQEIGRIKSSFEVS